MRGCDRSGAKAVSNIFGLSSWKKGVAIPYIGKMTGGAGRQAEETGSLVWGRLGVCCVSST